MWFTPNDLPFWWKIKCDYFYLFLWFCSKLINLRRARALQNLAVPMDATTGETSSVQYHNIAEQAIASLVPPAVTYQRQQRHCFRNASPGEFPLSANPSIVLHVLTGCNLDPEDLAKLEACYFYPFNITNYLLIDIRIDCAPDLP